MLSLTILASGSLNMALIACPDCQRKISSKAKQCIHCGCPISSALEKDIAQADQYRKWLGYFLAIPVLLGTGWIQIIANKLDTDHFCLHFFQCQSWMNFFSNEINEVFSDPVRLVALHTCHFYYLIQKQN